MFVNTEISKAAGFLVSHGATSLFRSLYAALLLALMSLSTHAQEAALPEGQPASVPLPEFDVPRFEGLTEEAIDRRSDALLQLFDLAPPAEYSVLGATEAHNEDPEALFQFVRDKIATATYPGSLRDPSSVLGARAGNDQDKAELLRVLFETAGFDARIAKAVAAPIPAAQYCSAIGPEPLVPAESVLMSGAAQTRLLARAANDFGRLAGVLDPASLTADAFVAPQGQRYWTQIRMGGDWVDADAADPSATFGVAPAKATALGLGGEDAANVRFEVFSETLVDGTLKEDRLLQHDVAARDAYDASRILTFQPVGVGTASALSEVLGKVVNADREYLPVLWINDQSERGRPFPVPRTDTPTPMLGKTDDGRRLTAIYLDATTTDAAGGTVKVRRVLMDVLDPAARAAGGAIDPAAVSDAVVQSSGLRPFEAVFSITVTNGGVNPLLLTAGQSSTFIAFLEQIDLPETDPAVIENTKRSALMAQLSYVHLLEALTRQTAHNADKLCPTIASPQVTLLSIETPEPDTMIARFDWMIDRVSIAGPAQPSDKDLVEAGRFAVWHGALASATETMMGEWAAAKRVEAVAVSPASELEEGITVLEAAAREGRTESALLRDAAEGYTILGSQTPNYWWRLDPRTGRTDSRAAVLTGARNQGEVRDPNTGALRRVSEIRLDEKGNAIQRRVQQTRIQRLRTAMSRNVRHYRSMLTRPVQIGGTEDAIITLLSAGAAFAAAGSLAYIFFWVI